MLPYLSWYGMNHKIPLLGLGDVGIKPGPAILDTVQEIAIYIHRFHNLDLFEQGWYQIKITMRLEDNHHDLVGMPARVVQYEAPNSGVNDTHVGWRIDDTDNSFSTQPFKIKYARQDVLLSIMIAFNLSMGKCVVPTKSAVIVKFELMYAPFLEKGSEFSGFVNASSAATHEFRIPPKALLGLHSYCPVYFDALHAVLVDISVHITLLKSVHNRRRRKIPSNVDKDACASLCDSNKRPNETTCGNSEDVMLVEGLLSAREILLEEMQKISKAIDHNIDLTTFFSQLEDTKLLGSIWSLNSTSTNSESSKHHSSNHRNNIEKTSIVVDSRNNQLLHSLSKDKLKHYADTIATQILYLWNTFLIFHRTNTLQVLNYMRETWGNDRRAEWSIWMVYSKVEAHHNNIRNNGDEGSIFHGSGQPSTMRRLSDPSQTAITRAELHRRSISQMKIKSRSIQDMQIYGDLPHVPIVIVERVMNAMKRSISGNSYFCGNTASTSLSSEVNSVGKWYGVDQRPKSRILKVVVFVHGFQGHHLDLRLVRNQWLIIDPKVECLMSEINEDKTFGDFREMGFRLAKEVASFLTRKLGKFTRSGSNVRSVKISFVGHSIGNVIIRTALADSTMEPYLKFLHTYVSLSGPHLGYLYSSNSLFNSGLWVLKKLKKTQCIHQLTFTDDPDLCNTFFYKLCQENTLDKFKNIILLSSPEDGYVPYHSARIEHCQASISDLSKRAKVFQEMLDSCLAQIKAPTIEKRVLMRCDVNFNMSSHATNLNTFIGRAAHIEFLETNIFVKFIMWSFPELFR